MSSDFNNRSIFACSFSVTKSFLATTASYWMICPYCLVWIPWIDDEIPSPANNSATDPATPNIVMNILCLYLNILRAVTFCVKVILLHNGVIRSMKILEPFVGGFGNKSCAAVSRSSLIEM